MISQNVCFNAWIALLAALESHWKPARFLLLNVLEALLKLKVVLFLFSAIAVVFKFSPQIEEPSDCRSFYLRWALF